MTAQPESVLAKRLTQLDEAMSAAMDAWFAAVYACPKCVKTARHTFECPAHNASPRLRALSDREKDALRKLPYDD